MPKSVSASSSGDCERISTFSGFRSRCRIRCAWMPASASAISCTMRRTSDLGSGPARSRSSSVPPGTYSSSSYAAPSDTPCASTRTTVSPTELREDVEQLEVRRDAAAVELRDAALAGLRVGDEQDVGLAARGREHVDHAIVVAQRGGQRPRAGDRRRGRRRAQRAIAVDAAVAARRIRLRAVGMRADDRRGGGLRRRRARTPRRDPVLRSRRGGARGCADYAGRNGGIGRLGLDREIDAREQRAALAARALRRVLAFADGTDADVRVGHAADFTCARTLS